MYEVGLVADSASSSLPMDHLNLGWSLTTQPEIESWAESYWRSAGYAASDAETLAAAGLTAVSFLERILPPGW